MKKLFAAAIVVTILLGLSVSGFAAGSEETVVRLANPWTEASLGEIEAATGLALVIPDGVEASCSYTADMAQASWKAEGMDIVERISFCDEEPAMDIDTLTALSGIYFTWMNTQSKGMIVGGRCPGFMAFNKGSFGAMMWYDAECGVVYTLSVNPISDPKLMGDLAETISPLETSAGETCMIVIDGCAIAHDLSATPAEEIDDNSDYLWQVIDGYGITYTDADGVVWGIYRAGEAGVFEIVVSSEDSPSPWTVGEQIWVGGSRLVELCVKDGRLTHILTDTLESGPVYDVEIVDTAAGEAAEIKSTTDMTASEYPYLTSYTRRNDKGAIYIGNDVTGEADITLNEIVDGPAYTAVYAHGDGAVVNVTGTVIASDDTSGEMASDFSGQGAIIVANDGAVVNVNDAVISTDGFERSALIVTELSTIRVENSELTVRGANPLTEAYDGYTNSADQNKMLSPPWVLGIQGGARVVNMIGTTPKLTVIDSTLVSGGWALISTDSGTVMTINVVDTDMSFLPESEGGMDSGWRIFGYDADAYGSGYGAYFIGDPAQYYYGATFNGVTYAAIITGAQTAHYASSNGTIELNDASGEPMETVEGKGQPTVINGVFGIMQHNSVSDGIYIEDGTIVNTEDAVVIHKAGSGDYFFDDASLNSAKGVLFQMIDNDDDSRVGMGSGGFSTEYNEDKVSSGIGFPGVNYDYTSGKGGVSVNAAYMNGVYEGNIYNGTGYYGQRGNNLTVTLGEGTVLNGDIALTSTIKGVPYSPEAIEGIAYYGDDIGYVLLDAEGNETDNEAEAAYIQIRSYTMNEYFLQGHVENMIHYNGAATISVVVEDGAEWNVAGESLITKLTVADGAVVKGTLIENADGSLTLTAGSGFIPAGEYGIIEAVGGGMNIGGGVDASGELNVEAAANAMAAMQNGSGEPS